MTGSGGPGEAIPRPRPTPDALWSALASVAPHRLREMERQRDTAFSLAAERDSLGPVRGWVAVWTREVEIERRPHLAQRRQRALDLLHRTSGKTAPAFRVAMAELRAIEDEAIRE
ncbi:hypothetical protein ACGFRB_17605 [Streptomyces sp. NPDC048718]|uniref:hypothetical protein n=1 Tax=Streptomyces sp. NPDC048718 TaxID=3365587 RepID=UPI0037232A30